MVQAFMAENAELRQGYRSYQEKGSTGHLTGSTRGGHKEGNQREHRARSEGKVPTRDAATSTIRGATTPCRKQRAVGLLENSSTLLTPMTLQTRPRFS